MWFNKTFYELLPISSLLDIAQCAEIEILVFFQKIIPSTGKSWSLSPTLNLLEHALRNAKTFRCSISCRLYVEALLQCRYSIKASQSHQGPLNVSIKFSKSDHRSIGPRRPINLIKVKNQIHWYRFRAIYEFCKVNKLLFLMLDIRYALFISRWCCAQDLIS